MWVPLAATCFALVAASAFGWAYFDLNIHQGLFVDRLGCGCNPHFNNNDLTLCLGFGMAVPMAVVAGISSRTFDRTLRLRFVMVSCFAVGYWFLKFCHSNWWL